MRKVLLTLLLLLCSFGVYPSANAEDAYYQQSYSTTVLGSAGVYSSGVFSTRSYKSVGVVVLSNVSSAANGLKIIFYKGPNCETGSPTAIYTANGTGWTYTSASDPLWYVSSVYGECAQVTYTNGGTLQGSFSITVFTTK